MDIEHKPLVTIVALCYNHEKYLIETLESIREQSYHPIQLIVADDASRDNSQKIIRYWLSVNWPEAETIFNSINLGITKTLNFCLQKAKGKYFHVIACDDILMPEKTSKMVNELEHSSDEFALIYSDMYVINETSQIISNSLLSDINHIPSSMPQGNIFLKELQANFIMAPTALIKTQSIIDVGRYDENLPFEDYDLFLRLSRKFEIKYLNGEPTVKYRRLSTSMSSRLGSRVYESNLYSYYKLLANEIDTNYKDAIYKSILCTTQKIYNTPFSKRRYYHKKSLSIKWNLNLFIRYMTILLGLKKGHELVLNYERKITRKLNKIGLSVKK